MEKTNISEVNMTLGEMKNYLSEWFLNISSKVELGSYDTFERRVVITEPESGEILFTRSFGVDELVTNDVLVSTSGIVNDELRGLIEQCHRLDKQIEQTTNDKNEAFQKH